MDDGTTVVRGWRMEDGAVILEIDKENVTVQARRPTTNFQRINERVPG
jgi:hypothetical protein